MKKYFKIMVLFLGLDFICYLSEVYPVYQSILIPIDDLHQNIEFHYLVLNYLLCIIFIFNIVNDNDVILDMSNYVITRCNSFKSFLIYHKYMIKRIMIMLMLKVGSFVLFDIVAGTVSIKNYGYLILSMFLTFLIWNTIYQLFYLMNMRNEHIVSILVASIFMVQYISLLSSSWILDSLILYSLTSPLLNIGSKTILWSLLLFVNFFMYKRHDNLRGVKND